MEPEQDAAMPSRALADVEVPFVGKIELAMCVLVCREQIRANGPGVMGHALLQQETVVRRLFAPRKFICWGS